jgi:hypothetical protein
MNKPHFWTWLVCLLSPINTSTMSSWHPPVEKTKKKKSWQIFQTPLSKKGWDHPWKVSLFVRPEFSRERDNKFNLKFYMYKLTHIIYRIVPRMLGFSVWMADFGATGISRCFGTWRSVQRNIQHGYTSLLVAFYLVPCKIWGWFIHISFEKQGNFTQKLINNWKMTKGPSAFLFQTPSFSNPHAIDQDLTHRCMLEFPTKWPRYIQKVKSWRWFQVCFIDSISYM